MIPRPPIPEPLWNTVPPEAQMAILAVLDSVHGRVLELEQRVRDLEARLKLNSTHSSKPPSSDPIGFKRKPPPRPPVGNGAGNRGIAGPNAVWSRRRRSARLPIVGPPIVAAVAKPCSAMTRPPWSIK